MTASAPPTASAKPKKIQVAVLSPHVKFTDADHAAVSFKQSYRSDAMKSSAAKTLTLVKVNGYDPESQLVKALQEIRASRVRRELDAWRTDWESRDTERHLSHYAKSFRSGATDLAAWSEHKRRVNAGKARIKVGSSRT